MASVWKLTRNHVTANGVLMLALGTALFTTEPLLTNPRFQSFGYFLDVILTGFCLLMVSIHLGFLAKRSSRRQIGIYLLLIEFMMACWLLLWISRSVPLNLDLLLVLAGFHGVFWGLWLIKLAYQLRSFPSRAGLISVFAATTSAMGMIIAIQASLTRPTAVTLVSCYAMYIGVAILTIDLLVYRALDAAEVPIVSEYLSSDCHAMHLSTSGNLSAQIEQIPDYFNT